MLTVESCCCGCTLRTGTKIILWTSIVDGVLLRLILKNLFTFEWMIIVNSANLYTLFDLLSWTLCICIPAWGISGVRTGNPVYLIPFLVTLVLLMVLGIVVMVVLAINGRAVLTKLGVDSSVLTHYLISFEIAILLWGVLNFYRFIVVLSFYKELEEDSSAEILQGTQDEKSRDVE